MTNDQAQQRAERLVNRVMPDVIVATSVHDPSRSSTVDVSGWKKDFKKVITAELLAVQRECIEAIEKLDICEPEMQLAINAILGNGGK